MHNNIIVALGIFTVIMVVIAFGLPFLTGDSGAGRLKALQGRREDLRKEATLKVSSKNSFRELMLQETFTQKWAKKLNLAKYVNTDVLRDKLSAAGWKKRSSLSTYLVFRLCLPIGFGLYIWYLTYLGQFKSIVDGPFKYSIVLFAVLFGYFMPSILLTNAMKKRDAKLNTQFPDALDLLLVCVEAGLSMDMALVKVTEEIGSSIPEVSEEFAVLAAELAYIGDRFKALSNLATRTSNADFKSLSTVLIQAERQGSPVSDAIRTISREARQKRVLAVEQKAAGLSPKMTVIMLVFIFPCLFLLLIGPAVIKFMEVPK